MKKATPNRFLTAGRPGVFKVKMSLGRAMKTTDLNGGLNGGFGTLGPASDHRRRIETENKAKCRRFGLGVKIECRTWKFWCESVALCT